MRGNKQRIGRSCVCGPTVGRAKEARCGPPRAPRARASGAIAHIGWGCPFLSLPAIWVIWEATSGARAAWRSAQAEVGL